MARITIEDCLKKVPDRFTLVLLASERARQLMRTGDAPLVEMNDEKIAIVALREIATFGEAAVVKRIKQSNMHASEENSDFHNKRRDGFTAAAVAEFVGDHIGDGGASNGTASEIAHVGDNGEIIGSGDDEDVIKAEKHKEKGEINASDDDNSGE